MRHIDALQDATPDALQEYPPRDDEVAASAHAAQLRKGFSALRFAPAIEAGFRDYNWQRALRRIRIAIIVALAVVTIFSIKDVVAMPPEVWAWTAGIRMFIMVPAMLLGLYGLSHFERANSERAIVFACCACLYGLTAANAAGLLLNQPLPYEGLMVATFFIYFMLGLRLHLALPICLPLVPLYALLASGAGLSGETVLIQVLYLAITNTVGAIGLYSAEHSVRSGFLNAQLSRFRAEHDPLTLLHNRRALLDGLNRIWRMALRQRQSVAVMLIDVDHFKSYNDHYGHVAGDECLQKVADAIRDSLNRPLDLVGRYGGEEFMAVAYPVSAAGIVDLGHRVRAVVEDMGIPHQGRGEGAVVTISVGLTCAPPRPGLKPTRLIDLADKALYQAKQAGRNCVEVRGPEPAVVRALDEQSGTSRVVPAKPLRP